LWLVLVILIWVTTTSGSMDGFLIRLKDMLISSSRKANSYESEVGAGEPGLCGICDCIILIKSSNTFSTINWNTVDFWMN
jgi:hypothetical protein